MPQQQRHNRVALAITVYFGSATASLAWILHRARPAREERTWSALVQDAASLWDAVPNEIAVFVFLNFFVSALAMVALITAALFLGRLSVTESQRLSHRLVKYAVFKMVFVGSVITPDPRDIAVWLAWFAVVGYLRVFLGAAKDRLESLLSSPGAQLGRHVRGVGLLVLVLVHNAVSFALVLRLLPGRSLAQVLLCAFDSAVVAIEGLKTLLRYAVHMADRYQCLGGSGAAAIAAASPAAAAAYDVDAGVPAAPAAAGVDGGRGGGGWDVGCWSGKGNFLYHAELVADVLVHGVTLAHYLHVWVLHGLSFHLIDAVLFLDMRAVLLSLLRRLRSHLSYRAATQRLNTTFRDVHPAALAATAAAAGGGGGAAATDCTICMDEIVHVGKQLPCGHVFHLSCLRAWLQQSGSESFTCPNCRKPILVGGPGSSGGQTDGGDGDGGQQRRESSWWLVRTLDRLYVRLVVALEPVLLTLLLSITLWLGGRAQIRRRAARSPPSPSRGEGYGESPGPATRPRGGSSFRARRRFAGDSDPEDEEATEEEYDGEEYGSSGDDDSGGDGRSLGWEEEEEGAGNSGDGQDADSDAADADREGAAAAARRRARQEDSDAGDGDGDVNQNGVGGEQPGSGGAAWPAPQRSSGWRGAARHMRTALGAGHGCGGCNDGHRCGRGAAGGSNPHPLQPPPPAPPAQHPARPRSGRGPGRWRSTAWRHPGAATNELGLEDVEEEEEEEEEDQQEGSPGVRRRGSSGRARRADAGGGGGGDDDAAGPSTAAAVRRRGALRAPPAAAPEVPSYSGDVLAPQAAAVARQIGRTISASLRSSWAAGGPCAGAVAWGGDGEDDDDNDEDEVSSRRRRLRPRSARPGGGGATARDGTGGGAAGATRAAGGGGGGGGRARGRLGEGNGRNGATGGGGGAAAGRGGGTRRRLADWN